MRKITCLILALLLLLFTPSCRCPSTLQVSSVDYPNLTQLKAEDLSRWSASNADYQGTCHLSVKDGRLVVSNKYAPEVEAFRFVDGYFLASRIHMDPWVRWYTIPLQESERQEPVTVTTDLCLGFESIDVRHAYLFTATGDIYEIRYTDETDAYAWECVASLQKALYAYHYDPAEQTVYVATAYEIFAVSLTDYTVTTIKETGLKAHGIYIQCLVKWNGVFYCGTDYGIYTYKPSNDCELWYPMV